MRYVIVTFKDKTQTSYNMETLRITQGFVKVEHSQYGNIALPVDKVSDIYIRIAEGQK